MASIFQKPQPGKATPSPPAVSSLTGRKDPTPTHERGVSVQHMPNTSANVK